MGVAGEIDGRWPDGKSCAASFTFDFDADTFILAEDPANATRPGALSQGLYEPKVGVPLLLKLLDEVALAATFFIPGQVAERFPESVEEIVAGGHEIGVHGYTHTSPTDLLPAEEEEELVKAKEILGAFAPEVVGYRSPSWDFSPETLQLLERHEFRYSSNLMDDIRPYRHRGSSVVELPVHWILDDAAHWWMDLPNWTKKISTNEEVRSIWEAEFAGIRQLGGCCVFTMHPGVVGRPGRLGFLREMIDLVRAQGDVFIGTCAAIAECPPGPGT